MLRKAILVLVTAVAGATAADLSSALETGARGNSSRGDFVGGPHMSAGDRGGAYGGRSVTGDYLSGGDRRGGRCAGLVGGTFAWPYCDYCTRHPGDRSC